MVKLYNFNKRENSTAIPSDNEKIGEVNLIYEQPYDNVSPSFKVSGLITFYANYCYVEELERYYWIDKWSKYRRNDEYILNCQCDTLATYRYNILNTTAFVSLSSTKYNIMITDTRLSTTSDTLNSTVEDVIDGALTQTLYSVVSLQVLGAKNNGMGFGDCYLLTKQQIGQIIRNALTDPDYFGALYNTFARPVSSLSDIADRLTNWADMIPEIAFDTLENIRSPYDTFLSAKLIPWGINNFEGQTTTMEIASVPMGTDGYLLGSGRSNVKTTTLQIPWHYSDFRNNSPYTSISLYIGGIGNISLNASSLVGSNSITLEYILDALEGAISGVVKHEDGHILTTFGATLGVPVPVAQTQGGDLLSYVQGTLSNALGASSGALNAVSNQITTTVNLLGQTSSGGGSIGSTVGMLDNKIRLTVSSVTTTSPTSLNVLGRPYRQTVLLNTLLNSYVVCENASISCNGTLSEITAINGYLNGGIYLE